MSYATVADLFRRATDVSVYALCGGDPAGGGDPQTAAEDCLESASDEIDGYLRAYGYDVPIATVPSLVRDRCLDIAVYHLHRRASTVDDRVRTDYEDAIRWCQDVAAGRVTLGVEPPPVAAPTRQGFEIVSSPRKFSRTTWSVY